MKGLRTWTFHCETLLAAAVVELTSGTATAAAGAELQGGNNRPSVQQQPHSSTPRAEGHSRLSSSRPAHRSSGNTGPAGRESPPSCQRPTQHRQVHAPNLTWCFFPHTLGNGRQPAPGSGKHRKCVSISEFKCGTFYLFVLIQDVSI